MKLSSKNQSLYEQNESCCVYNAEIHLFLIFLELFRYEKRYGPDTFVAHLASPLKSTTYNGLDSYNPNKYIGMFYKKKIDSIRYLTKIYSYQKIHI